MEADPAMTRRTHLDLSRRERQIMESLFRRGSATVAEVRLDLPEPPSYSAVRTMIGLLEAKGQVRHRSDGRRYVYAPVVARDKARGSAVKNLLRTFFDDSVELAVASLLDPAERNLTAAELDRIEKLIERARRGEHK
jgi:predicted transcriptional regulator